MEVGSLGGLDKNRVYGLSNTTADNLRLTRSVSTVGSSQSISSSQSKEFVALQQHMAQLTDKYDHLSAEYAQLKASHAQQRVESEQIKASQAQQKAEYEQQKMAYEQQKAAYKQLRKMVMNMANSGTCAPNPFWPYNHRRILPTDSFGRYFKHSPTDLPTELIRRHLTVAATLTDEFTDGYIRSVFHTLTDSFTDG